MSSKSITVKPSLRVSVISMATRSVLLPIMECFSLKPLWKEHTLLSYVLKEKFLLSSFKTSPASWLVKSLNRRVLPRMEQRWWVLYQTSMDQRSLLYLVLHMVLEITVCVVELSTQGSYSCCLQQKFQWWEELKPPRYLHWSNTRTKVCLKKSKSSKIESSTTMKSKDLHTTQLLAYGTMVSSSHLTWEESLGFLLVLPLMHPFQMLNKESLECD